MHMESCVPRDFPYTMGLNDIKVQIFWEDNSKFAAGNFFGPSYFDSALAHIIQNSPSKIFQTQFLLYIHDNYNGLVMVLRNGNEIVYLCMHFYQGIINLN